MQRWEYREVFLSYQASQWSDSSGDNGALVTDATRDTLPGSFWTTWAKMDGELVGVENYPSIGHGNPSSAKWIFKRPKP